MVERLEICCIYRRAGEVCVCVCCNPLRVTSLYSLVKVNASIASGSETVLCFCVQYL